ncbi:cotranscriptional regulator FAM172A homolog isoform X2 [Tachysurus ichikawai]
MSPRDAIHTCALWFEGYGVIVLNPNENALEVEKVRDPSADAWDEPAEKRERKEECEGKQKKAGHEKYRNPQKERETKRILIRLAFSRSTNMCRRDGLPIASK